MFIFDILGYLWKSILNVVDVKMKQLQSWDSFVFPPDWRVCPASHCSLPRRILITELFPEPGSPIKTTWMFSEEKKQQCIISIYDIRLKIKKVKQTLLKFLQPYLYKKAYRVEFKTWKQEQISCFVLEIIYFEVFNFRLTFILPVHYATRNDISMVIYLS